MQRTDIPTIRLFQQGISTRRFSTPGEVVCWLGAAQAQDYYGASWALGLRIPGATDDLIETALTEGTILRTHIMRPTWHFVTPADIRWIQALTAPRVHTLNSYMYRQFELDEALLTRCSDLIAKALSGGVQLTREEIGVELSKVGIIADGVRLGYILHYAELEALICSGGRRGKQHTLALLEERAPNAKLLPCDEALAELTRRYFTSHGPATIRDFAWWSGLTVADVKAGLALCAGELVEEVIDGKSYWLSASLPTITLEPSPTVHLLPPFDEYGIAYKDHSASLDPDHQDQAKNAIYGGLTVIDGQGVGYWRRTLKKGAVVIRSEPWRPLTTEETEAFADAGERLGAFLGRSVVFENG